MIDIKLRKGRVEDAESMAIILREIGWSQKRNALPLEGVANPIAELIQHCLKDSEGRTLLVAVDENDQVIGFMNVHWVPFIMLGSWEGYVPDVFVSPKASGKGVGRLLVEAVMEEVRKRGCTRLMLTNGRDRQSYKQGFYSKLGWTEKPQVANFVHYYREPWL